MRNSAVAPGAVGDLSEAELIARVQAHLPPRPGWMLVGIGDDAAVVEPERNRLEVLTVDALVEGVHFDRAFTPARAIGHRALAVNLSDIAAMGAAPRLALLSFALPPHLPLADFDDILAGLTALALRHRVHVAGGNLTRSPGPLMLDVMLAGTVKRRRPLLRSGARAGDDLYVSGTIGAATAGLAMLSERPELAAEDGSPSVGRYLYPDPRIRLGLLIGRTRAASACMDLSDGLADAVRQVAAASGVGAAIDAEALPIEAEARAWFTAHGDDAVRAAVEGGDDYELLVAAHPRHRRRLEAARRLSGVSLTRIGVCTKDRAVTIGQSDGSTRPMPRGYAHFR